MQKWFYVANTALLSILLSACGGSSDEKVVVEEDAWFELDSQSTSEIAESNVGTIAINTNSQYQSEISIVQTSGPKTYFKPIDGYNLSFVAPNVVEDTSVEFDINLLAANGDSHKFTWSINISNREIVLPEKQALPNVFSSANLAKHESKTFDSNGVPLFIQDNVQYYYPITIAQYSYDLYQAYFQDGSQDVLDKFLVNAQWLRDNCEYTEYGFCSYRSYFPLEAYKLTTDWTTAMGQGQAISSLLAAHWLTGDESYAQVAYDAVSAFRYPIEEKGLTADFEGVMWYEEYGSEEMPAHVLNGYLFSLSGVRDFFDYYNEDYASEIFNIGIDSLAQKLNRFDFGFTTRYDYSPLNQLASTKGGPDIYHEIHIFQLSWILSVVDNQTIYDLTHKFLKQDMAGIKSIKGFGNSNDINSITASHTIDTVEHGVDKLTDANWTWLRYWSSHRSSVNLDLHLNESVLASKKLEKLVLTAPVKQDLPSSIDVYSMDDTGEYILNKSNITLAEHAELEYSHETGGYTSYTVIYNIDTDILSENVRFKLYKAESGITKLRELDLHFDNRQLLEKIIDAYRRKRIQ